MPAKPNLATAKRLFRRRNTGVKFTATWHRKPVYHNGVWSGLVEFTAEGYRPSRMRIYSDRDGTALF